MVKDRNLEFGTYIEHNISKTYEDMSIPFWHSTGIWERDWQTDRKMDRTGKTISRSACVTNYH